MALDKVLKIYDENGNQVDYDILASDVKFLPDGKDLPTKLTEMEDAIEDAGSGDGTVTGVKVGSTPYNPDSNGVVDLSVPFADKATKTELQNAINSLQNALNTLVGSGNVQGVIDTFNEVKAFLSGIDTSDPTLANQLLALNNAISAVQTSLATKANSADVYTKTEVDTKVAEAGSGAVSVTTNQDGTFVIHVGSTDYTINLNHTHENMAKLVVCEESDLPSTLAKDTIYAQVDDAETPTEIQSLWIAGLEFVGGGGSEDDGLPKVTYPKDESTLDLGENDGSGVSKSIVVRAKNLDYGGSTTGLTIEAIGTGLSLSYGQQTGQSSITIPQSNGVVNTEITVAFGGSGGLDDGGLHFKQGSSVLASVDVVASIALPEGWIDNSAWNGQNSPDGNIDHYTAPGEQAGFITTKFFPVAHVNNYIYVEIKAGVVSSDSAKCFYVFKKNNSDATTFSAYSQVSDPKRKAGSDFGNQNYISATMKRSELANCYIYDYGLGNYLWAGANVDTSTPPHND